MAVVEEHDRGTNLLSRDQRVEPQRLACEWNGAHWR